MVYSRRSNIIVYGSGNRYTGIPFSHKALAPAERTVPANDNYSANIKFLHVSTACFCPSSVIKAGLLAVNKAVPSILNNIRNTSQIHGNHITMNQTIISTSYPQHTHVILQLQYAQRRVLLHSCPGHLPAGQHCNGFCSIIIHPLLSAV